MDSFTAFDRKVPRPMAGKAKLIVGLTGEWFCLGDELEDVGDEAEDDEATVSVEPFSSWEVGIDRDFVVVNRPVAAAAATAAAAAKGLFDGIAGGTVGWLGEA